MRLAGSAGAILGDGTACRLCDVLRVGYAVGARGVTGSGQVEIYSTMRRGFDKN